MPRWNLDIRRKLSTSLPGGVAAVGAERARARPLRIPWTTRARNNPATTGMLATTGQNSHGLEASVPAPSVWATPRA